MSLLFHQISDDLFPLYSIGYTDGADGWLTSPLRRAHREQNLEDSANLGSVREAAGFTQGGHAEKLLLLVFELRKECSGLYSIYI